MPHCKFNSSLDCTAHHQAGFTDPRILEQAEVAVNDPELKEVLGEARFFSITYRCLGQ